MSAAHPDPPCLETQLSTGTYVAKGARLTIAHVAGLFPNEVEFARDVGLAAAPDHEIAARAQALARAASENLAKKGI